MLKIKQGDSQEYHEGDMVQDIADYAVNSMGAEELREWAYDAYVLEASSWEPSKIREQWANLTGGNV